MAHMATRTSRGNRKDGLRDLTKAKRGLAVQNPSTQASTNTLRRFWWMVVVLIGINLVYAPLMQYGFVNYDDPQYIVQNRHVTSGLTWEGIIWAFTTGHEANWHPLTWLSHMLDVRFYGLSAGGHHLTNVLFHVVNTVLLFWLLLQMTGAPGASMFVAALFAVHPLHVESVAWIAERKDVLSTFLGMLTLCAYVRYVRQPRPIRYLTVALLFAAALMAKPMLVTLPFVLLLLDFWPLGRLVFRPKSNLAERIWEKVPLLILTGISSVVTFIVQQRGGAMVGVEVLPLVSRIANACVAYFTYTGRMFWPTRLAVLYPAASIGLHWWLAAALGLLALSVLSIWAAPRRPYIPVGWFWYVGTLVPVIGLVQVGRQALADRYTYIPLIGLFLIIAFGAVEASKAFRLRTWQLTTGGGIAIAACLWLTDAQIRNWSSSNALWEQTLKVTFRNSLAHFNLGAALEDQGRLEDAIYHYSEALRIEPGYADAHCNLASALMKSGKTDRLDEVHSHLTEAIRLRPNFPEAQNAFGIYLLQQRKLDEAISHFSEAIRLKPDYPVAHNNLATAFGYKGLFNEAISAYMQAVRVDPGYAEAHKNLGVLLATQGRTNDAIAHFSDVLRIAPNNAVAQEWLIKLKNAPQ